MFVLLFYLNLFIMLFKLAISDIFFYNFVLSILRADGYEVNPPSAFGAAATASMPSADYNHIFIDTKDKTTSFVRGNCGSPMTKYVCDEHGVDVADLVHLSHNKEVVMEYEKTMNAHDRLESAKEIVKHSIEGYETEYFTAYKVKYNRYGYSKENLSHGAVLSEMIPN
jgi:hypothetical protein